MSDDASNNTGHSLSLDVSMNGAAVANQLGFQGPTTADVAIPASLQQAQNVAGGESECTRLRKEVHELRTENQRLRTQCYVMSVYLDRAAKLCDLDIPAFDRMNAPLLPNIAAGASHPRTDTPHTHHNHHSEASSVGGVQEAASARKFKLHWDMKDAHNGAINVARFSPNGILFASGSVDKTVKLWSLQDKMQWVSTDHRMSISDMCWGEDSSCLLTASLDGTCLWHDVERQSVMSAHEGPGLVLSCELVSSTNTFLCSTIRKNIALFDARVRSRKPQHITPTPNVVNTICCEPNGLYILSGDDAGLVQVFDVRNLSRGVDVAISSGTDSGLDGTPHHNHNHSETPTSDAFRGTTILSTDAGCPITHLHQFCDTSHARNARFLVVNGHDSVLRMYDRGSFDGDSFDHFSRYKLRHTLTGHRSRKAPIRSASWCGAYVPRKDDDLSNQPPRSLHESTLIASGSTDGSVYVFDVSERSQQQQQAGASSLLLQRLDVHKDVVYGTHFHPMEPMLMSYSADASIKLWVPSRK
eukprot:PhM_4_TR14445/c0_g4_i1/m.28263/K14963/WDR5, SWD3, CPS30; COMPASS component SWD3